MTRRRKKKGHKQTRHDTERLNRPRGTAPAGEPAPRPAAVDERTARSILWGVVACFVLSGFAALLYQTAWLRQFSLVFGTSELAVAAVLAAYMGGLAAGAAVAGRLLTRVERPVLVYGVLEGGIAVCALAVPLLLGAASAGYVAVLGGQAAPPDAATLGQPLFYLAVAFVVLALPTGFMGATLPLLIRHAVQSDRELGPRVALLYATNTAGAVAGTITAAFFLLPALGLNATVWVGVAVNAAVFGIAVWLSKKAPAVAPEAAGDTAAAAPAPRPIGFIESCIAPAFRRGLTLQERYGEILVSQRGWILALILVSGANAFYYEVLWTRMLSHVMGGSIYAFATMLAAFLTGIALGGGLAGPLARDRERAALAFAATQALIAMLSVAVYLWMGPLIPESRSTMTMAGMAVAVMLPATIFIGATFPLAVRILAQTEHEAGEATARIYAWNTVGAIFGAILAGFVLIPALGFEGSIKLAVCVNLGLALWASAFVSRPNYAWSGAAAAMLLVVIAAWYPNRPQAVIGTGGFEGMTPGTQEELYFAVGRSSTVYLAETSGMFELRTNGLPEASVVVRGAPPILHSQAWLTALPVAARPEAESVLVIGFGGGVAVEGVPSSVAEIDAIELEQEVINANRLLAGRRAIDPLADPRLNLVINDARNALRLTDKTWDVIVSQPSHPWTSGASHLFTREFTGLVKEHLNPGGVFLQWMNSEFLDEDLLRTLAATVLDTFENVRVYASTGTVLLFLASDDPLDIERQILRTGQPLTSDLLHYSYMGLNSADDFVAALALDERGVEAFAEGAPLSTDNRNYMATHSRFLGDGLTVAQLSELLRPYDPLLDSAGWIHRDLGDELNFSYIATRLLANGQIERTARMAEAVTDLSTRALIAAIGFTYGGDSEGAESAIQQALRANPENVDALFQFAARELPDFAGQAASEQAVAAAARLSGAPAAVFTGWPLGATQNWPALAALDNDLARSNPTDIWYPEVVQLRADWRTKVLDQRQYPFDALRMVDRALVISPSLDLYVLRAAAASALDDDAAFVESGRYVYGYLASKLARAEQGTYVISDEELQTTRNRLTAFDLRLTQVAEAGGRRAANVHDDIRELIEEFEAIARERGQEPAP